MRRLLLLLMLIAVPVAGRADTRPVILVTGFEPFGGSTRNVSWDGLEPLIGTEVAGYRIEAVRLPVLWGAVRAPLESAIVRWKPVAVLSFGEGPEDAFRIETKARNRIQPRSRDNADAQPGRAFVLETGPAEYTAALPVSELRDALALAGFPVRLSSNAGAYLCEEAFYMLIDLTKAGNVPAGFVHVPKYPPKTSLSSTRRHRNRVTRAQRILIETLARWILEGHSPREKAAA